MGSVAVFIGGFMPEVDGQITLRIDEQEAQVLFWALINRVRQCSDERRATGDGDQRLLLENELVQLGALLDWLATFIYNKAERDG